MEFLERFGKPTRESAAFRYKALEDDTTIRLVRFEPRSTGRDIRLVLKHRPNYAENGKYVALSYCWGSSKRQRHITINGKSFAVGENLWAALSAIRKYHDAHNWMSYWIDAICLNQDDLDEKNAQVHQMWRIYSAASEVFAWLGPSDRRSKEVFRRMTQSADACMDPPVGLSLHCDWHRICQREFQSKTEQKSMYAFCSREYFSRAWVRPECYQARKLIFLAGQHQYHAEQLLHYLNATCRFRQESAGLATLLTHHSVNDNFYKHDQPAFWHLLRNVETYGATACSDVRDRIYVLFGDPDIVNLNTAKRPAVDYWVSREELAVRTILWYDDLEASAVPRSHAPFEHACNFLLHLLPALDLTVSQAPLKSWPPYPHGHFESIICRTFYQIYSSGEDIGYAMSLMLHRYGKDTLGSAVFNALPLKAPGREDWPHLQTWQHPH